MPLSVVSPCQALVEWYRISNDFFFIKANSIHKCYIEIPELVIQKMQLEVVADLPRCTSATMQGHWMS